MRWTRMLALVCLVPLSCTKPEAPGPDGAETKGVSPMPEPPRLAISESLNGRTIEVTKEGPWTIRRGPESPQPLSRKAAPTLSPDASAAPGGEVLVARARDAAVMSVEDGAHYGAVASAPSPLRAARPSVEADFAEPTGEEGEVVEESAWAARLPAPSLRAGSTDDNAEFEKFLNYLHAQSANEQLAGRFAGIDVSDRRFLRVVDANGRPLPAAEVAVVDEARDRLLAVVTTYGDGRAPFYPSSLLPPETSTDPEAEEQEDRDDYLVQVRSGDVTHRVRWDGVGEELVVRLEAARSGTDTVDLDVLFLIDTTGSMSDEIARIKASLLSVTQKLRSLEQEFELRYGAVLYRDLEDEYITKLHPFTADIEKFDEALKKVVANGGGDMPESLNQGLAVAVDQADWRPAAAKLVFLIADAPPHMDYAGDTSYADSVRGAVARGIKIHSVAASGLDAVGTLVFRQVSQFTRGKFIFIEYGSTERTAKSHGVKGKVESNNLDQIIYEQIRDEVASWGRGA